LAERSHQIRQALHGHERQLRRQIADLRKTSNYAEAVPLAERYAQVIKALWGEGLPLAEALIDLGEFLIATDRPGEAEPVLQRAFAIVARDSYGKIELRKRSQIDATRLAQSVSELRSLLADARGQGGQRRYAREPSGIPTRRPAEPPSTLAEQRQRPVFEETEEEEEEEARPTPAAAPAREKQRHQEALELGKESVELAAFASSRPDRTTPEGALAIEAGRLAYQIPNRMWVGVQETVEVRLGAIIANEIMQGFVGRGDVKLEHVPIVETMTVSLVCQPGTFDIEPRSKEAQLVKPDLVKGTAFHQDDFARWIWLVTPCQRGKHTLLVKVSAAIRDSRGLPTTSSLPDKIIAVTVQVHLARAAVGIIRYIAPLILSGVITALVGVFTKDYWWPAVRSWLGW
jgi:hypothetical protein